LAAQPGVEPDGACAPRVNAKSFGTVQFMREADGQWKYVVDVGSDRP
jgi:hypothetical protein